jgi:hypothetical protein
MNIESIRYEQVERLNGSLRVWFHYNRMTLVVLLSAVLTLFVMLRIEQYQHRQARQDAATLARAPALLCYDQEKSTSVIIAGTSQRVVDRALRDAIDQTQEVRGILIDAQQRASQWEYQRETQR